MQSLFLGAGRCRGTGGRARRAKDQVAWTDEEADKAQALPGTKP